MAPCRCAQHLQITSAKLIHLKILTCIYSSSDSYLKFAHIGVLPLEVHLQFSSVHLLDLQAPMRHVRTSEDQQPSQTILSSDVGRWFGSSSEPYRRHASSNVHATSQLPCVRSRYRPKSILDKSIYCTIISGINVSCLLYYPILSSNSHLQLNSLPPWFCKHKNPKMYTIHLFPASMIC